MFKKLDIYFYKRFLPVFLMTFLICMLIVEMQFFWKHVADLVGKGVGVSIFAEFFLYSSAMLVPMALPLAILLASLMTFGNLGENFELTAMKSAGVSLFRIMRPLIILITVVCIGAYFFSNNILPISQQKLWTLVFSLRAKSPELEIPQGEFYTGIDGYHIYVEKKEGNVLLNMMIYDFSKGFENASVTVADTGRVLFTADKKHLMLVLRKGEGFENLKNQTISYSSTSIPHSRENFKEKRILLDFDSNFERYDESVMKDQYISRNFQQLTQYIDSVGKQVNQENTRRATEMIKSNYLGREIQPNFNFQKINIKKIKNINIDSAFLKMNYVDKRQAATEALNIMRQKQQTNDFNVATINSSMVDIRRNQIELYRKFTLSFACLIFFFIGAPLGAIIRKGGLGMPIVTSVIMFVVYYIIDNTGFKMAREGIWETWQGMWLSSAILLPIGIFLTYKAAKDSELFRSERYILLFAKIKKILLKLKNRI